ncbi:putative methyltransferase [[Clostridium] ultunense Esp]|uniref:Putative methyltransferase n=2 Tax=Schnuerera ultunensis TaxID=45497 RepID=M1ZI85_9FIRM|nr:16S rRNA (guanine(966)-N(2))-methyltransferase RsmD [Schnuerera ultunensis]CCQ93642.1 putative methyltransferase [[Clostridium] ultunense Esp]SHD76969.1 putative methyltransferase [[Clostridium] ultunense Esp]
MRVIAGDKKGFRLKGPKGKDTRPTEDRIKESLFNILRYIDKDSMVLDLFAGSGSIGIEFLSRGAKRAFFVDRSYESIRCIKENLEHTGLKDRAEVIKSDAIKTVSMLKSKKLKFNYIFIDPPYGYDLGVEVLEKIWGNSILEEKGIIILEHEKGLNLEDNIYGLIKMDSRSYGHKSLSFYAKK